MMKYLTIIFLISLFILNSCDNAEEKIKENIEDSLDSNLIAYWNFEDNTLDQSSGVKYDAEADGEYLYVDAYKGKGIFLLGKGDNYSGGGHVLLPFINFESMDEFNISMWTNIQGYSYPHGDWLIFWGDDSEQWLGISNSIKRPGNLEDRYIQFGVGVDIVFDGVNYIDQTISTDYSSDILEGEWHNYMINYKNGTMYAYIDGELIGSKVQEVGIYGTKGAIGCHWWFNGEASSARFIGVVDEVKVFNRALSNCEIYAVSDKDCN